MGEGGGIALYHPVVVSESVSDPAHNIPPTKSMLGPNSLYTSPREEREEQGRDRLLYTPSIAFRHLPPNSARFSYATEGALFISAQLSSDAVSALRKVRVPIRLWKQPRAQART